MFLIYVLILYICSIGCSFFIKNDSNLFKIKNIIGFCILISILQVLYYPFQYFKCSSLVFHIITSIIILLTFLKGIFNLKLKDFEFLKKYEFYVLFILIFIIIKIIPGLEAGDDWFYMSLFIDNADINSINTINPRTGLLTGIDSVYLYQGFYQLMSFLYKIQDLIFPNNVTNIYYSYRTTVTLLMIIFSSNILYFIREKYKDKTNNIVFYFIQILSILLVGVLEWSHIYWGSFMLFQIFIPLYFIVFNEYKNNNKLKYILFVINLASISLASSSLFLIPIVCFGFFVYDLFNKNVKIEDYYFILIPSMIYALFLFDKLIFIILIIILFIIINLFKEKLNNIINKYLKYVVIVLPILFALYGIIIKKELIFESYRLSIILLLFNLIISCFIGYLIVKKQKVNSMLIVFLTTFIFFFNPLVAPFVTRFMTSSHVYYRLFYITKNPLIITIIFLTIYDFVKTNKYKKYLIYIYYLLLILLICKYSYNLVKGTVMANNYNISYNYIVRENNDSISLGKEMVKLKSNSKIYSIYFAPRIFNKDLVTDVVRYPDALSDNVLVNQLYIEDYNNIKLFNEIVNENGYDYLITYNKDIIKEKLEKEKYNIIYENNTFILIEVKK